LLNAIEGVASHEGHILIMTTNKLEELDEVLVRPARVGHAGWFHQHDDATGRRGVHRMCDATRDAAGSAAAKAAGLKVQEETHGGGWDILPTDELKSIADEFAALFPEKAFSPAEIQGFLLKRKR
jgi:chaperone BCS1